MYKRRVFLTNLLDLNSILLQFLDFGLVVLSLGLEDGHLVLQVSHLVTYYFLCHHHWRLALGGFHRERMLWRVYERARAIVMRMRCMSV